MLESTDNLVAILNQATKSELADGLTWYNRAHRDAQTVADECSLPVTVVSAVIAALSPRCKWDRNLDDARNMCRAYVNGWDPRTVVVCTFNRQRDLAARILEERDPNLISGPKTTAFAHCIADPNTDEVVIDSHAWNAFVGERVISGGKGPRVTKARFARAAAGYREVAHRYGFTPMQCQAVIWLAWKRLNQV